MFDFTYNRKLVMNVKNIDGAASKPSSARKQKMKAAIEVKPSENIEFIVSDDKALPTFFIIIVKCLDFSDKACDIEDKVLCNSIVDLHDTPTPCSGWRTSRKMQEKIFKSGLIWMLKITYNFHLVFTVSSVGTGRT